VCADVQSINALELPVTDCERFCVFITLAIDDSADQFRRIAMAAAAFAGMMGNGQDSARHGTSVLKKMG